MTSVRERGIEERLVGDVLVEFHQNVNRLVAGGRRADHAVIVESLAAALLRLFPHGGPTVALRCGRKTAVAQFDRDHRRTPQLLRTIPREMRPMLGKQPRRHSYDPIELAWVADGERESSAVLACLPTGEKGQTTSLWFLRPKSASTEMPSRWSWFGRNVGALRAIALAVTAALRASLAEEQERTKLQMAAEIQRLKSSAIHGERRAERTARLLSRIARTGPTAKAALAEEAATSLLQHLLGGPGLPSRPVARLTTGRRAGAAREVADEVTEVAASLDGKTRAAARLHSLSACFIALGGQDPGGRPATLPPRTGSVHQTGMLSCLPHWIWLSERGMDQAVGEDEENTIRSWDAARSLTVRPLGTFLVSPHGVGAAKENGGLELRRTWVRLWLCHELLNGSWRSLVLAPERRRYSRSLAVALREGIRAVCFGHRDDYRVSREAVVSALSDLVDLHAHHQVGLPRELDVRGLLREHTDDPTFASGEAALRYARHVIDVYLTGHWFLALNLPGDAPRSVADHLAAGSARGAGEAAINEIRQAFSLAALFHDTGHLLFPHVPGVRPGLHREDARLKLGLDDLDRLVHQAGTAAVERCLEDLENLHAVDLRRESGVAAWLDQQRQAGEPDHGLLSAWYLQQVCGPLETVSQSVLRRAVRAVLLHNSPLTISGAQDPLAALLTLCSELRWWRRWPTVHGGREHVEGAAGLVAGRAVPNIPIRRLVVSGVEPSTGDGSAVTWSVKDRVKLRVQLHEAEKLCEPVLSVALCLVQQLGRVTDREAMPWFPEILLQSRAEPLVAERGLTTQGLLELLAHGSQLPVRAGLARWLTTQQPFTQAAESGADEVIRVDALTSPLYAGDIRRWLPRLADEAAALLLARPPVATRR